MPEPRQTWWREQVLPRLIVSGTVLLLVALFTRDLGKTLIYGVVIPLTGFSGGELSRRVRSTGSFAAFFEQNRRRSKAEATQPSEPQTLSRNSTTRVVALWGVGPIVLFVGLGAILRANGNNGANWLFIIAAVQAILWVGMLLTGRRRRRIEGSTS